MGYDNTGGAASPGDSGGANMNYTSFSPSSWSKLYWGPSSAALPRAGLNGTLSNLGFSGISGTTATWQATLVSNWTNPGPGAAGPYNVPIRMTITISGLGANPWILASSVTGLDPGPGAGIGAVVNVAPSGTAITFTANVKFEADIPTDASGFIPLNTVPQGTSGATRSSYTGAFYWAP